MCEAFIRSLKNAYDDPDTRATAKRKLHKLKQGDKDCSAYHAEFSTYATTLNYNDITKNSFFSNGANQGLKTALSYQASPPDTFDAFIQLCIKLDNKPSSCHPRAPAPPTRTRQSTLQPQLLGPPNPPPPAQL